MSSVHASPAVNVFYFKQKELASDASNAWHTRSREESERIADTSLIDLNTNEH